MIDIDEQREREALVAWLRSEVDKYGGDWVPSLRATWLASARLHARTSSGPAEADAERYRHIKTDTSLAFICLMRREPDEWDAEIDAAVAQRRR